VFEIEFYYKYAELDLLTPLVWLWGSIMLYLTIIKKLNKMKVSELIEQLKEIQSEVGDIELVLSVTDHTDHEYNFDFPGFDIGNVFDEEFDDLTDYGICEVSI
jgi:hypothetical protein